MCVEVLPSGFAPEDWCILNSSARLTPLLKCSLSKLTFCCKGVEECLQLGGVVHAISGEGIVAEDGLRGVGGSCDVRFTRLVVSGVITSSSSGVGAFVLTTSASVCFPSCTSSVGGESSPLFTPDLLLPKRPSSFLSIMLLHRVGE